MSLDRSLKSASTLSRHRNVLTRAERLSRLSERGKFDMAAGSPLGLPKVGNRKVAAAAKTPKKDAAAPAAGAAAAAPAAGAKAAAPAAGAKAAAPAAKAAAKK